MGPLLINTRHQFQLKTKVNESEHTFESICDASFALKSHHTATRLAPKSGPPFELISSVLRCHICYAMHSSGGHIT